MKIVATTQLVLHTMVVVVIVIVVVVVIAVFVIYTMYIKIEIESVKKFIIFAQGYSYEYKHVVLLWMLILLW